MINNIRLTNDENEVIEWALGAMDDYWNIDQKFEGIVPENYKVAMPKLINNILIFPINEPFLKDVLNDLIYRITDQIQDMVYTWEGKELIEGMKLVDGGKTVSKRIKIVIKSL